MRLLLDTCTFLWAISGDKSLSKAAADLVADSENEIYLSVVSEWEIALKHRLGKLSLPETPGRYIQARRIEHRIVSLPLDEEAALYEGRLPALHRDPFDRMLICQSIVHGLGLITPDKLINLYPVRTLW